MRRFRSSEQRQTGDQFFDGERDHDPDDYFLPEREPERALQRGASSAADPWAGFRRVSYRATLTLGAIGSFSALLLRPDLPANSPLFQHALWLSLPITLAVLGLRCRRAGQRGEMSSWFLLSRLVETGLFALLLVPALLFNLNAYLAGAPQPVQGQVLRVTEVESRPPYERLLLHLPPEQGLTPIELKMPSQAAGRYPVGRTLSIELRHGGLNYPLVSFQADQ